MAIGASCLQSKNMIIHSMLASISLNSREIFIFFDWILFHLGKLNSCFNLDRGVSLCKPRSIRIAEFCKDSKVLNADGERNEKNLISYSRLDQIYQRQQYSVAYSKGHTAPMFYYYYDED